MQFVTLLKKQYTQQKKTLIKKQRLQNNYCNFIKKQHVRLRHNNKKTFLYSLFTFFLKKNKIVKVNLKEKTY